MKLHSDKEIKTRRRKAPESLLMTRFLHVSQAEWIADFRIRLLFNNGDHGIVDLKDELTGPVFGPLRDPQVFRSFRIEGHTVAWPNGADFAPEFLHGILQHRP